MQLTSVLHSFMDRIWEDPRIGPSHISLFLAILVIYSNQENEAPIRAKSCELMRMAKISGKGTYYRCMRDLQEYGYINYTPSYNRWEKSMIVPQN